MQRLPVLYKMTGMSFIFAFLSIILVSCLGNSNEKIQSINVDDLEQAMRPYANLQVIDLRSPEAYLEAHLPGAVNIDQNSPTFEKELAGLNPELPVYFYCANGLNSAQVIKKLSKKPYPKIYDITGGYAAWSGAGKKVLQVDRVARPEAVTRMEYDAMIKKTELMLLQFSPSSVDPSVLKRMESMVFGIVKRNEGELKFKKYNYRDQVSLARDLKVNNLPTLILYRQGEEVWRFEGMPEKSEIEEAIQKHQTKNYNSNF
jgi:rhodanese-related sulfurtransferase